MIQELHMSNFTCAGRGMVALLRTPGGRAISLCALDSLLTSMLSCTSVIDNALYQ